MYGLTILLKHQSQMEQNRVKFLAQGYSTHVHKGFKLIILGPSKELSPAIYRYKYSAINFHVSLDRYFSMSSFIQDGVQWFEQCSWLLDAKYKEVKNSATFYNIMLIFQSQWTPSVLTLWLMINVAAGPGKSMLYCNDTQYCFPSPKFSLELFLVSHLCK